MASTTWCARSTYAFDYGRRFSFSCHVLCHIDRSRFFVRLEHRSYKHWRQGCQGHVPYDGKQQLTVVATAVQKKGHDKFVERFLLKGLESFWVGGEMRSPLVALLLSTEVRIFFSSSSDAVFAPGSARHVTDFVRASLCMRRSSGHVHRSCSPRFLADLFHQRTHPLIDFSRSARESLFQRRQPVLVCHRDRGASFLDCLLLVHHD